MADKKLIIDFGSGWSKGGFEGDANPMIEFQTIIGYPNNAKDTKLVFGKEAIARHSQCKLLWPMKNGIVENWQDMEKIIENTFLWKVKVEPMFHQILLTETTLNTKENKKKLAEIMFEKHDVPSIYIANQQLLALHACTGSNTGTALVVDMGDDSINIVPVHNGKVLPEFTLCLEYGGRNLTEYLSTSLHQMGYGFSTINDLQLVRCVKEKYGVVEMDFDKPKNTESKKYQHPGCDEISIDAKYLYGCPEVLFRPSLMGVYDHEGIHISIQKCIDKCEESIRSNLYSNIVLVGGTSMFNGLADRLQSELSKLTNNKIKIVANSNRKNAAWVGASQLISSVNNWVTKEQFKEKGI